MFRCAVALSMVLAACGGGSSHAPDGGGDAPPADAASDTGVDGGPGACPGSTVDPDGDGVGWACDPVESLALDSSLSFPDVPRGSVTFDSFIAERPMVCASTCSVVVAAADGRGAVIALSDSANPQDAWAQATYSAGGIATTDGEL